MTPHLPRHQLEELAADRGRADSHLDACAQCTARLRALERARASFLARRDPQSFALTLVARRPKPSATRFAPYFLAAAAAIMLLWLRPDSDAVRYKGSAQKLQTFVQRAGQVQALADGQPLAAGDQLAFVYTLSEPRHLLLISIDETGAIARYYSGPLEPATRAQLPVGIELDAHRGEERLFALFSREPIDEARVRAGLKTALREAHGVAGMKLLLPVEQTSTWFRKP